MASKQLFLGVRKENGQIGYLSEGYTLPEFFNLICKDKEDKNILIDFTPVIEILKNHHKQITEQTILEKYNAIINYWEDSKSYSNFEIKIPKFESLSLLSNELISSLQPNITSKKNKMNHRRIEKMDENNRIVKTIEIDVNIFIDVMLCFIHSKASLEIESFKKDTVLAKYCNFLYTTISDLFNTVVEFSDFQNNPRLDNESLLYYISFNKQSEINSYIKLLNNFDDSQDLRLSLITKSQSREGYNQGYNHRDIKVTKIDIEYRIPNHSELETAKILRNLLYKIISLQKLLIRLRDEEVSWEDNTKYVEELKQLIEKLNIMYT